MTYFIETASAQNVADDNTSSASANNIQNLIQPLETKIIIRWLIIQGNWKP